LDYQIALPGLSSPDRYGRIPIRRGKLAFSGDGSILAAYQRFDKDEKKGRDVLHFIDIEQRQVQQSRSGLYSGQGIHDFGFLERYLICVGRESLAIWNATTFELVSEQTLLARIESDKGGRRESPPLTRLAIDARSNTFAVAIPELTKNPKYARVNPIVNYGTQLYVFSSPDSARVILQTKLPSATVALLSASGRGNAEVEADDLAASNKGYLLLDAGACIRQIRPGHSSGKPIVIEAAAGEIITDQPLTSVFNEQETDAQAMDIDDTAEDATDAEDLASVFVSTEDNRPVVRTQELANVLDYPSHAMPSMADMFRSVLSLYAGKAAAAA